jgi:hypothetical protein
MTDYVRINRDDAHWLMTITNIKPIDQSRLLRISREVDSQPYRDGRPDGDPEGFDVYTVIAEYQDRQPFAVRQSLAAAVEIARVFNLAESDRTAAIFGHCFDEINFGTRIEIPPKD